MSGTETRRRRNQIGVRLLPEEHAALIAKATTEGVSPGELLRRALARAEGYEQGKADGRRELAREVEVPFRRLANGCIAVVRNEPYPDDPRWTPWTRFVGPYLSAVDKLLAAALTEAAPRD